MQTYRTETTVSQSGLLTVRGLPFHQGEKVEVIILSQPRRVKQAARHPLFGKLIRSVGPFDSVAEEDWSVLQ